LDKLGAQTKTKSNANGIKTLGDLKKMTDDEVNVITVKDKSLTKDGTVGRRGPTMQGRGCAD
jgi:hypothetical protein